MDQFYRKEGKPMISEKMIPLMKNNSAIRMMFEEGNKLAAKYGRENVFDFSLGNPSVPAPAEVNQAIQDIVKEEDSLFVHGYMSNAGYEDVRETIAQSLNRRFGTSFHAGNILMTVGAASGLNVILKTLLNPGEQVITFAPYFVEYGSYVRNYDGELVVVSPNTVDFQPNLVEFEEKINEKTKAVIINTPNNPSGAVYSADTLKRLAAILTAKQVEYGHDIFLISDEPYREIVFDGATQPYPASFYANSLTCYSWSKSLSLPGERIGYVAVNPTATDADLLVPMMGQISRGTGHNCPPSSIQLGVAKVIDQTADLNVYETNMNLLYDALTGIGFDVVRPGGTFYIFPKALEDDAVAFCMKAKEYDLILVPSDSFGVPGYFRMAYCIDTEKVKRSIPVFEKFAHEVYGL